jgi:hypothetical protein
MHGAAGHRLTVRSCSPCMQVASLLSSCTLPTPCAVMYHPSCAGGVFFINIHFPPGECRGGRDLCQACF